MLDDELVAGIKFGHDLVAARIEERIPGDPHLGAGDFHDLLHPQVATLPLVVIGLGALPRNHSPMVQLAKCTRVAASGWV